MGAMKRFAEDLSEALGFSGRINTYVMEVGNKLLKEGCCHAINRTEEPVEVVAVFKDGQSTIQVQKLMPRKDPEGPDGTV